MAKNIPVLGAIPPPSPRPKTPLLKETKKWDFSFRYWKQIKYFGLDQSSPKWFVSLLDKLQILSQENIDDFIGDSQKKTTYRYHNIDWGAKNIPIQRNELNWLHPDYLRNEDEYPLVQFQISKSLGRIVGFFDENRTFNIVLLDPLHNIQPSMSHNYRVDLCDPLHCEYTHLKSSLEELHKNNNCDKQQCSLVLGLNSIYSYHLEYPNVLILRVSDEDMSEANESVSSGKFSSYTEIFQTGIYLS